MGAGIRPSSRGLTVGSITIEGFISYRDRVELDFHGGVMGVVGKNGAGKSTLVSKAITWALYGKCAPERMGSGTQALRGSAVVHDDCSECLVSVSLYRGSDQFVVTRSRKTKGSEKVEIVKNGENLAVEPEQIVGATYDVFVRTVVRGQNDPWNFAEATDARKREILDAISGADVLQPSLQRAKDQLKQLKTDHAKAVAVVDTLTRQLAQIPEAGAYEQLRDRFEQDRARKLDALDKEIAAERAWLADAIRDHARWSAEQDALGPEPVLDTSEFAVGLAEAAKAVSEAARWLGTAGGELRTCSQVKAGHECPTCGQIVPEDNDAALKRAQAEKTYQEASEREIQAKQLQAQWNEFAEQRKREHQDRLAEWRHKRNQIPADKRGDYQRNIARLERDRAETAAAPNPYDNMTADQQRQRTAMERDIAYNADSAAQIQRSIRIAEEWVQVLSPKGVAAHLAESTLVAIEAESNRWLSVLSGGSMSVEITSQKNGKEQIDVKVVAGQTVRDLLQFSGGQRTRINLAIDLAVSNVVSGSAGLALSLLVLDEAVFSGLDDEGKAAVADALSALGVRDIVVIDHDSRLTGVFPRTVVVEMDGNASTVREI